MSTSAQTSKATMPAAPARRALASWTLGCAVPLYLALRGGGYEPVLRDQVGIAVWWIAIAGVLAGVLPLARPSRAQLLSLGALALFAVWSGVGALWSLSGGSTVAELSRLSSYAALLALAVLTVRADTRTWLIGGVTSAIVAIAALALLSRLHPAWFPPDRTAEFLAGAASRLNYPLNYWNGLAAFAAFGVPLLVHFAAAARRLALRSVAAACIPVLVSVVYLTFSRGGWIELAVGLAALLALSPARHWRVLTVATAALGSALLIASIHQRHAVDHGLLATAAGRRGGTELIAIAIAVCVGVGLIQGAISLVERHRGGVAAALRGPSRLRASIPAWAPALLLALVGLLAFLLAGGPGAVAHAWRQFENPAMHVAHGQSTTEGRLLALSGDGRWQYWLSCLAAFAAHPLGGIGSGTFQLWWAAHGSIYSYVRNAHSLYFETLAETGVPGLALLLCFLFAGLWGIVRRLGAAAGERRSLQAAMLGACLSFCCAAAFDWVWQIPAIPALLLLTIAAGCAGGPRKETRSLVRGFGSAVGRSAGSAVGSPAGSPVGRSARAAWIALALLGALAIAWPMVGAVSLRESASAVATGRLGGGLADARSAERLQPFASQPPLQQALVLERESRFAAASRAARGAIAQARTDWRSWLVLSRIEAERGRDLAALAAWRKARSLDRHDPLFSTAPVGRPRPATGRSPAGSVPRSRSASR